MDREEELVHQGKPTDRFVLRSREDIVIRGNTCDYWHASECVVFNRGLCNKGSKCHFAHPDKDKRGDEKNLQKLTPQKAIRLKCEASEHSAVRGMATLCLLRKAAFGN